MYSRFELRLVSTVRHGTEETKDLRCIAFDAEFAPDTPGVKVDQIELGLWACMIALDVAKFGLKDSDLLADGNHLRVFGPNGDVLVDTISKRSPD